jgi:hypothetical protein
MRKLHHEALNQMQRNTPFSSSIGEFCERYAIDKATFHRRRAEMPRTIRIGVQHRILASDEAEWLQRKRAEADREMSAVAA